VSLELGGRVSRLVERDIGMTMMHRTYLCGQLRQER